MEKRRCLESYIFTREKAHLPLDQRCNSVGETLKRISEHHSNDIPVFVIGGAYTFQQFAGVSDVFVRILVDSKRKGDILPPWGMTPAKNMLEYFTYNDFRVEVYSNDPNINAHKLFGGDYQWGL